MGHLFTVTLFSSAALIFTLQPMFSRLTTPLLGGVPAVWNASMAFFQAALLAGYLYAHLLSRLKSLRAQGAIHTAVMLLSALALPPAVSGLFGQPSTAQPALWLIGTLAVSVGAPFAAASATAPLLQAWYARSGLNDAGDPYHLYAASNLGSLSGLLLYPLLAEPLLGLSAQRGAWGAAYLGLTALMALCAAAAARAGRAAPEPPQPGENPGWRRRLYWAAAAAVPAALTPGVTLHISTDITAAPLFWVVPLALYLVTYILAFSRRTAGVRAAAPRLYPLGLLLLFAGYSARAFWPLAVGGSLAGFFVSALVCHIALAESRPHTGRLTEFYLIVALGGVAGGVFSGLLAPVIFNNVYEYSLALAAAALFTRGTGEISPAGSAAAGAALMCALASALLLQLKPAEALVTASALGAAVSAFFAARSAAETPRPAAVISAAAAAAAALALIVAARGGGAISHFMLDGYPHIRVPAPWDALLPAACFVSLAAGFAAAWKSGRLRAWAAAGFAAPALLMAAFIPMSQKPPIGRTIATIGLLVCAGAFVLNRRRPRAVALLLAAAFAIIFLDSGSRSGKIAAQHRSFFGVMRTQVLYDLEDETLPLLRVLVHGNTIHGAQLADPLLSRRPLTYYDPRTALGGAITAGLSLAKPARVGLIGLGTGTSACLLRPGDELTVFEIDPNVVRAAAGPGADFSYMSQCQPAARIVLGDARLRLAEEPDGAFDMLVLDAFSSDSVPVHLITKEALALYLRKVGPRGIVVLHLSKLNLALPSEAARIVHHLGVPSLFRSSPDINHDFASYYGGMAADAMIVANDSATLLRLPLHTMAGWKGLPAPPGRAWSDDYVNVFRALWENLNGDGRRLIGAPQ